VTPPAFWQHGHTAPWILRPLSWITAALTARRVGRPGWTAPVPVICCGNPGAGGSGKTPLALDLAARLTARGKHPAFLTRGHGGRLKGPLRATSAHDATDIGDEAQLLATTAPTYVGPDRAGTARLALTEGADVLVMDDGLQNPTLTKSLSLLVIDGGAGFGNAQIIPSGPLREPIRTAAARCRAAVLIGNDSTNALSQLPPGFPILHARIVPNQSDLEALPPRLLAFAGIGRPEKFFETLTRSGHPPIETRTFADHRPYTPADLDALHTRAATLDATLVTTEKDLVRLKPAQRRNIQILRIALAWNDPTQIEALLDEALPPA
jgi:tetraacyldisaccharide 4'-kinase